jgi:hypothetical protein
VSTGFDRRARVDDRVHVGGKIALLGSRSRARFDVGRDAAHFLFVGGDVRAFVGKHLLAERGEGLGELLVQGGELLLLRLVEIGAAANVALVEAGDEPLLLGVQPRAFACVIDGLDPLEEPRVERDLVGSGGELRTPFLLQRLILRVGHVAGHDAVDRGDAVQPPAGPLERLDRVGEGGRLGIADDGGNLAASFVEREFESPRKQFRLHLVPGRNAIIGARPFGQQDVARHCRGGRGGRRLHVGRCGRGCC